MTENVALVVDEYGNEMFFGHTTGECQKWCFLHGVTGSNGEYIALGTFNTATRYFDLEDYAEIDIERYRREHE